MKLMDLILSIFSFKIDTTIDRANEMREKVLLASMLHVCMYVNFLISS